MSKPTSSAVAQPQIAYRTRGYLDYRAELLALLPSQRVSGGAAPLSGLDVDDDDDWIVRLCDGWARVAEIVGFYDDRIINAAFVATAIQPSSLSHIYQSLGHRFQPNLTATTVLAYELTGAAAGLDAVVRAAGLGAASAGGAVTAAQAASATAAAAAGTAVPVGMTTQAGPATRRSRAPIGQQTTVKHQAQVRAVPGPDGRPPVFVTDEPLQAHLGASQVPLAAPPPPPVPPIGPHTTQLELDGTTTGLAVGQPVVVEASDPRGGAPLRWIRFLTLIVPDTKRRSTRVGWTGPLGSRTGEPPLPTPALDPAVYGFGASTALFGATAVAWSTLPPARRLAVKTRTTAVDAVDAGVPLVTGGLSKGPLEGGPEWAAVGPADLPGGWSAVWAEGDLVLAAAGAGGIFRRQGDGPFVQATVSGSQRFVNGFGGSRDGTLLAAAASGTVYGSVDEGRSWSRVTVGPPTVSGSGDKRTVDTHQLPSVSIRCVLAPSSGGILVGADDGAYLYTQQAGWKPFASDQLQGPIFDLNEFNDGVFAAATQEGVVWLYDIPPKRPPDAAGASEMGRVYALAGQGSGPARVTWAGGESGVWRCELWTWTQLAPLPAGASVTSLAVSADGILFAGTSIGVFRYDDGWSPVDRARLFETTFDPADPPVPGKPPPPWLRTAFAAQGVVLGPEAAVEAAPEPAVVDRGVTYPLVPVSPAILAVWLAGAAGPVAAVATSATAVWACSADVTPLATEWPGFHLEETRLQLAKVVRGVSAGVPAVIEQRTDPDAPVAAALVVTAVGRASLAEFGQHASVTTLQFDPPQPPLAGRFDRRASMVWTGAAALPLFRPPAALPSPASGPSVTLGPDNVPAAVAGRLAVFTGRPIGLGVAPLGGVTRVDGSTATTVALAEVAVNDVLGDGAGGVLAATGLGVFRLAAGGGDPVLLPGPAAFALAAAGTTVLAATGGGVSRLEPADPEKQIPERWVPIGLARERVRALAASSELTIALTSSGALQRCADPAAPAPAWSPLPAPAGGAAWIAVAGPDVVVSTPEAEIFRLDGREWRPQPPVPGTATVTGLLLGADGAIWLATDRALYSLAPSGGWQLAPLGDAGALHALGDGADGGILVAADAGLYERTAGGPWSAAPADPAVDVAALTAGADGEIWIGSPAARSLAVPPGAPGARLEHREVFRDLPAGVDDVATLDQGGVPAAVAKAFADAGAPLDTPTAVVEAGPAQSWRVRCGAALYVVTARPEGPRRVLAGYEAPTVAYPRAPAAVLRGAGGWPVAIGDVLGTLRVRPELTALLPAAKAAPSFAEPARLAPPPADHVPAATGTPIALEHALAHVYDPQTVLVHLNAVSARQGLPVKPVLGNGDPTVANQRFNTPSAVAVVQRPAGSDGAPTAESTLKVLVDGMQWMAVDRLLDAGPEDHVYAALPNADGSVVVQFGDGRNGARLPAGTGNVTAEYLEGGGPGGEAPSGALIQPLDRPQMVRGVHNPLPASVPPKPPEPTARSASVRVLDRVVTLADVEDVALAEAGVESASADQLGGPDGRVVAVSLALTADAPKATVERVGAAIDARSGGQIPLRVVEASVVPVTLELEVTAAKPDAAVAVRRALAGHGADGPGQPLRAAAVVAAATAVATVGAARVVRWGRSEGVLTAATSLQAGIATWRSPSVGPGNDVTPAELLVLDRVSVATRAEASP